MCPERRTPSQCGPKRRFVTLGLASMGDFLPAKGYETVSIYRNGAAAKLELNRPERMNALNEQLRIDLLAAVADIAHDDEVRAVLLTGAGRAFSSGADLRENRAATADGHPDVY